MGLFDNIIGTGAIEEVDPLGMENITDDNNPSPGTGDGNGGGTGTGNGSGNGTGGTGSGLFGGFGGKKDDSKGQDGSVLIIKDETPVISQIQNQTTTTNVNNNSTPIDTNSEIPDIDIGGDMNFGALVEDTPQSFLTETNIAAMPIETPIAPALAETPVAPAPVASPEVTIIEQASAPTIVSSTIAETIPANPVMGSTGAVNSLFESINNATPAETIHTDVTLSTDTSSANISLIDMSSGTENVEGAITTPVTETTTPTHSGINLLDGLNGSDSVTTVATDINVNQSEVITTGIDTIIPDSIEVTPLVTTDVSVDMPTLISVDTPPENISEKAVTIATDIQKTKESLAERISEFLKELEALKASDEALLKEKQAAIAKLEEAKRPIEEELKKIQDDEKRINDTIDLLSNIKNI